MREIEKRGDRGFGGNPLASATLSFWNSLSGKDSAESTIPEEDSVMRREATGVGSTAQKQPGLETGTTRVGRC